MKVRCRLPSAERSTPLPFTGATHPRTVTCVRSEPSRWSAAASGPRARCSRSPLRLHRVTLVHASCCRSTPVVADDREGPIALALRVDGARAGCHPTQPRTTGPHLGFGYPPVVREPSSADPTQGAVATRGPYLLLRTVGPSARPLLPAGGHRQRDRCGEDANEHDDREHRLYGV